MSNVVALRSRFGDRVKTLLQKHGMAVGDLAKSSQIPLGRIEKILEGTYVRITISDMDAIAAVLETPLYRLLAPLD